MVIKNVALVGASGILGPYILEALLQSDRLDITVLLRQSSRSTFNQSVKVVRIPDDYSLHEELSSILYGQDALVIAFSGGSAVQSKALIRAAISAGVKLVIPADWGSCDSSDPRTLEMIPLYQEKVEIRDFLVSCEGQGTGKLSWTSLITGHLLDYGLLDSELLGINLHEKTVMVFDGGESLWSSTTRATVGQVVRRILELGEEEPKTKNKLVYVQEVKTSQKELIAVVENISGRRLTVNPIESETYITEYRSKYFKSDGSMDYDVLEALVAIEGILHGDWSDKKTLINDVISLETAPMEPTIRRILESVTK